VQPFERLRSLARWGEPDEELLVEMAGCLAEFDDDPAGLVVACRRLLDHHRGWGQLWWLCARVLGAARPSAAATSALDEIARDRTPGRLAAGLPFPAEGPVALLGWPEVGGYLVAERPDLTLLSVVVDEREQVDAPPVDEVRHTEMAKLAVTHLLVQPFAAAPDRVALPEGSPTVLDATPARVRTWLVAKVGTLLPDRLVDALLDARAAASAGAEIVGMQRFDRVVGPRGLGPTDGLESRIDAPVVPELLRPLP